MNSLVDNTRQDHVLTLREAVNIINARKLSADHALTAQERTQIRGSLGTSDTIQFDPRLMRHGSATIHMKEVGGVLEGNSALVITGEMIIHGPSNGTLALAGRGRKEDLRTFMVQTGANLTLRNLKLDSGSSDSNGGTIFVEAGANVKLHRTTITRSYAFAGGGAIYNVGNLTVTDSTLSSNEAREGGAINNNGLATISKVTLSNNKAVDGGAYHAGGNTYSASVTPSQFVDCQLLKNKADDRGGAIFLHKALLSVVTCDLRGNTAYDGGAAANEGGDLKIQKSTLTRNNATNGGAIFAAYGSGGPQVGGTPDGGSGAVSLSSTSIVANVAKQGGGIWSQGYGVKLDHSSVAKNRADIGGGIYQEHGGLFLLKEIGNCVASNTAFIENSARLDGGAVFVMTTSEFTTCRFERNVAARGSAVFNELASAELKNNSLVQNVSRVGEDLFNNLGLMTVTDKTGAKELAAANAAKSRAYAQAPPKRSTFRDGIAGLRYALAPDHNLWRFLPGVGWRVLDDRVLEFQVSSSNGDCFWRNDRRELYQAQPSYGGMLMGSEVPSLHVDARGTIYWIAGLITPNSFARYRSLTSPLLDSPQPHDGENVYCLDPPSEAQILRALSMDSSTQTFSDGSDNPADWLQPNPDSPFYNVRSVVEHLPVDTLDEPRYFPGIGVAQMHFCQYKCTVYYETDLNGESQAIIYVDKNHLVPYDSAPSSARQSLVGSSLRTTLSVASVVESTRTNQPPIGHPDGGLVSLNVYDTIQSLTSAADGTMYMYGGDYHYYHTLSTDRSPLVLARLTPGGVWRQLRRVHHFALASDSTLYMLDMENRLLKVLSGTSKEMVIANGITKFTLDPNGTLTALCSNGRVMQWRPGSARTALLESNVQKIEMTPDGTILVFTKAGVLEQFDRNGHRRFLHRRIVAFETRSDGTSFVLTRNGVLKQLQGGRWHVLDRKIQKFTLMETGELYVLDEGRQLRQLTSGNNWVTLHRDVRDFAAAPGPLESICVLTTQGELKRQEFGQRWFTMEQGIRTLSIDRDGVILGTKANGLKFYFYSWLAVRQLDPVGGDVFCTDHPSAETLLWISGLFVPGVQIDPSSNIYNNRWSVVIEPLVDELDTHRIYNPGGPSRLHHCHYRSTITDITGRLPTVVVHIENDHLIRGAGPSPE